MVIQIINDITTWESCVCYNISHEVTCVIEKNKKDFGMLLHMFSCLLLKMYVTVWMMSS